MPQTEKTLVLMIGPPCAGKSSTAREIVDICREVGLRAVRISSDDIRAAVDEAAKRESIESPMLVYDAMMLAAEDLLRECDVVIVDATNWTRAVRLLWVDLARSVGADVAAVIIRASDDEIARRNMSRGGWRRIDPSRLSAILRAFEWPEADELESFSWWIECADGDPAECAAAAAQKILRRAAWR